MKVTCVIGMAAIALMAALPTFASAQKSPVALSDTQMSATVGVGVFAAAGGTSRTATGPGVGYAVAGNTSNQVSGTLTGIAPLPGAPVYQVAGTIGAGIGGGVAVGGTSGSTTWHAGAAWLRP